jgi:cyclophilin family peptidyl-prolyl cis-trans isomerase
MRRFLVIVVAVVSTVQIAGCPYVAVPSTVGVRVRTSLGEFVVELDPEHAPITVLNFLQYVEGDFYDGTIFHRVVPDFIVQGGGFTAELVLKETRPPIPSEADNGLSNVRGAVAMARTDDPNSAAAQFFINLEDNVELDATTDLSGYTVFGRVIEGMELVDRIAAVPTEQRGDFADIPVEGVIIDDIEVIELPGGPLELTASAELYLESIQFRTVSLARELLAQTVGFLLFPP